MSQAKHFLNNPSSLVLDSLTGLCALNPQLALDPHNKIVYIKSHHPSKVALICGGGSGHEPAHAAFVGKGILTSAVCGSVFASPNASQVTQAIKLVDNDKGTVIIVKNYTGDVLNFGLAKEQYAALHPEKADSVKFVVVGDDVAVGRQQGSIVGRRGLAGTVLVYKIAGALAERGASLSDVHNVAEWVAGNLVTIGASLGHTHVPGTAPPSSDLSPDEIEIGMGIHNESGHRRLSPVPPLSDLIPQLLDLLTSTTDPDRSFVPFSGSDDLVLLVNNLGSTSELELAGIVAEIRKTLDRRGFNIQRVLAGTFMTSLNMLGFSITLLRLPKQGEAQAPAASLLLSLLDDTPQAPGWKWSSVSQPLTISEQIVETQRASDAADSAARLSASDPAAFVSRIKKAAQGLINAEPEITRMDSIAGDGDCGLTLKAGAEAVLQKISEGVIDGNDVIRSVIAIAQIAEEAMGGTSGALYSIFFSGLAQGIQSQANDAPRGSITPQMWGQTLSSALEKLYSYTRARPPSRTLVDPLSAFIEAFTKNYKFDDATKAAGKAAEETKNIDAKAGRSAYVEGSRLKDEQVADPGAWGVKIILENLGM
ncbi:Dak1 domain-containing protein [Cyathus striatus]|nr:Dak1 domain-containing protein [Cyathus striatus]